MSFGPDHAPETWVEGDSAEGVAHPARDAHALTPVSTQERVSAVDTLRGVALLGILPINIVAFALPLAAYVTPMNAAVNAYRGPFEGLSAAAWLIPHFVCDLKMMTIFSMLFGAGLVLMSERSARRQEQEGRAVAGFAAIYYRRLTVLALIGLFHGFVLWYGDILFYYALSGLFLYPLRNVRARTLIVAGLVLLGAQLGLNRWEGQDIARIRETALQAEVAARGNAELTPEQENASDAWESIEADNDPTPAQVEEEVATVRGSAARRRNTEMLFYNLSSIELAFWSVRALGSMLIGMGMMKLGVLSAQLEARAYVLFTAIGYGVGLPLVGIGIWQLSRHRFEPTYVELVGRQYNFVGSLFVAMGHVGAVMLACKHGFMRWLTKRLALVGQMALSNYLSQSIICVTFFSGWGLGLFARLTHPQVLLFAAGIWMAQLAWSPWWLARFRYGPAEWLWRSGTYGRWEKMAREADPRVVS